MLKTVGFPSTRTGDQTIIDGNLVIGTAGKGIDFSATPGTGTSELLDDYEEGTWTPNQGAGLTVVGAFTSSGTYTKIGRTVYVTGLMQAGTSITIAATGIITTNLPFTNAANYPIGNVMNGTATDATQQYIAGTTMYAIEGLAASSAIFFSATYSV